jgi:hypothetical protein
MPFSGLGDTRPSEREVADSRQDLRKCTTRIASPGSNGGTCVRCSDRRRHRHCEVAILNPRPNRIVTEQPDRIRSHATSTEAPALAARDTIQTMLRLRELTSVAGSWTSSTSSERDEARFAAFSVTADRTTPAVRDTAPQRHRRLACRPGRGLPRPATRLRVDFEPDDRAIAPPVDTPR